MVFCGDERSFSNTQKSLEAQLYSQSLIFDLFFLFFLNKQLQVLL